MPADHHFCPRCATRLVERPHAGRPRRLCPSDACGWVHYDNPLPVVAAIVEHAGRILLVRSPGWPQKWFGLVTGFLERGETPEAAVLRELEEELGLSGEVVSLVGAYAFPERNELIVAYHVRATGEIKLGPELEAYRAVEPDRLRDWPFGTGLAVRDWLARRRG